MCVTCMTGSMYDNIRHCSLAVLLPCRIGRLSVPSPEYEPFPTLSSSGHGLSTHSVSTQLTVASVIKNSLHITTLLIIGYKSVGEILGLARSLKQHSAEDSTPVKSPKCPRNYLMIIRRQRSGGCSKEELQ